MSGRALTRARRAAALSVVFLTLILVPGCRGSDRGVLASGSFYPLQYAPGMVASIKSLVDAGKGVEPEGRCFEEKSGAAPKELVPHDFSHARGRLASMEREAAEPLAYQAWGQVEIKNTGAAPATSATVELPFSGEFSVGVPSQVILGKFDRAIPVGSIAPGGAASVRFWTNTPVNARAFQDGSRIVFREGAAPISYSFEVQGLAAWFTSQGSLWLWVNALVLVAIALGVALLAIRVFRLERRG